MRSVLLWSAVFAATAIFSVAVTVEASAQSSQYYCMCRSKTNPNIASCKSRKVCHGNQYCSGYCLRK
jgi:hypothetical protein